MERPIGRVGHSARVGEREVVLAEVHSVGTAEQGEIDAVVHPKRHPRSPAACGQGAREREARPIGQHLRAQLQRSAAPTQHGLGDPERVASAAVLGIDDRVQTSHGSSFVMGRAAGSPASGGAPLARKAPIHRPRPCIASRSGGVSA